LQSTKVNICYERRRVTLEADGHRVTKEMFGVTDKRIEGHAVAKEIGGNSRIASRKGRRRN
jgi:hypothetical protein